MTQTTHTMPDQRPAAPAWRLRARQATIVLSLAAMQAQWAAPALAAVSQKPLLSVSDNTVLPNFVLTLDNSESMSKSHMPENSAKVGTYTVDMGGANAVPRMHPSDTLFRDAPTLGKPGYSVGFIPGTVTGNCADNVFECQMRSADVNTIYYNPAILYQPWRLPNQPDTRMKKAEFTAAYLDPNNQGTAGTKVNLSTISNNLSARWCTTPNSTDNSCPDSNKDFNPAIFYVLNKTVTGAPTDPSVRGNYVKYDLNKAGSTFPWGFGDYPNRTDCQGLTFCGLAQEQQNFANWFTYHRARILMTKGAVTEAFATLGNSFRLGWGDTEHARTSNTADGTGTVGGPTQGVREFSDAHKVVFLKWLQAKSVSGSTPLRFATRGVGEYFKRSDAGSPWRTAPELQPASSSILGCRRAGHILTTDGYYNDDTSTGGNFTGGTDIDGADYQNYKATPPYQDTKNKGYLADLAMQYWAQPLLASTLFSNASDYVLPTTTDPATWLHLNQFMVGLGVEGTVDQDTVASTMTTATSWPQISADVTNQVYKIDDMMHASLNARGRFFSARDGATLQDAISKAIDAGLPDARREAGAASSSATAVSGDTVYIPEFNPDAWRGDVSAYSIGTDGRYTLSWRASERLPGFAARNITTSQADGTGGEAFDAATITALDNVDAAALPNFINYLRGDTSNEGTTVGTFRVRKGKLPDFINSQPLLVKGNLDKRYDVKALPGGGGSYRAFVSAKAARRPLLFVGGNGGMLHAFDGSATSSTTSTAGQELFAFVPRAAFPKLHLLGNLKYDHQYYVDGPLTEVDAYRGASSTSSTSTAGWANIVIGTMGAGGKSVFALDVTNGATGLDADKVMWELTSASTGAEELGLVTSRVQAGKVQSGGWYAFIGNGHDSASGKAVLLVVNLFTGAVVKAFELPAEASNSKPNGLSGVTLVENTTGEVIAAYAGDLHGQVWRFEFNGDDTSKWVVGFGGKPLFVAKDDSNKPQMISAAPAHFTMPSASGTTGNLVVFGTGRLVETTDAQDTSVQSIYAVLDTTTGTTSGSTNLLTGANGGRQLLQKQNFTPKVAGNPLIQMSSNAVTYKEGAEYGWYVDLDLTASVVPDAAASLSHRPKVIYQPQVVRNLVLLTAVVPPDPNNGCASNAGLGYTFLLPVMQGGQLSVPSWDTNGDGIINSGDKVGQGFDNKTGGGETSRKSTNKDKVSTTIGSESANQNGGDDDDDDDDTKKKKPPTDFDECSAGGDGCGKRIIADQVWKRLVKPPF